MSRENLSKTSADELRILGGLLESLKKLDDEGRERILRTAETFFRLNLRSSSRTFNTSHEPESLPAAGSFSEDRALTPKQFIFEKKPLTDVERVACLAFYLTHYRGTPQFKTLDISKLNTEAAQIKFSNTAFAVNNASKANYLAAASRGTKQLSAVGEQFVLALPDRDRAKAAMTEGRRRRGRKRKEADRAGPE